jgi:hypothetical protein
LIFDWPPSGGEQVKIQVQLRALPHTDYTDLICLGREDIAEFNEHAIELSSLADICGLMAAKNRSDPNVSRYWSGEEVKYLTLYEQEVERAAHEAGIVATGYGGVIQRTWP